jgi:tetratricopeptide (TPR) repeat protein
MSQEVTYTGARATPELVGRDADIALINQKIRDVNQSHVVYITGQGGIGKTRLVDHSLKNPPQMPDDTELLVAKGLVDLYHTSNSTVKGLTQAIQASLSSTGEGFENYLRELGELNKYEINPTGQPEQIHEQQRKMVQAFLADLNRLSEAKRIILVLDTVEKLFYQEDPAVKALNLTQQERPAILQWLVDTFLPNIRNMVILLAGRPGPTTFIPTLQELADETPQLEFETIDLIGLTAGEVSAYFDAVAEKATISKNPRDKRAVEIIKNLDQERRLVVFHSLRGDATYIRPIILALAIDHMVITVPSRRLPAFSGSLQQAESLTDIEREQNQKLLGSALVDSIQEDLRPADEIIAALGWLRRGANAELLAEITDLDLAEVEENLDQISDLSFIKKRENDQRIFLHDEIYDLLQQEILPREPGLRDRVLEIVEAYYDRRINTLRNRLDELYQPLAESYQTTLLNPDELLDIKVKLREAIAESLHYRLQRNAVRGFEYHYRQAEEAVAAFDEELGIQLRTELLTFWTERNPDGNLDEVDGLSWGTIVADAAVRLIEWFSSDNRFRDAGEIARKLQQEDKDIMEAGDTLARLELDSWTGNYLPFDDAEALFSKTITHLESFPRNQRTARWAGILARAYHGLGYKYQVQERNNRAIEIYRKAVPQWRKLKSETQLAGTLSNLALACAGIGTMDTALQQAKESLRLRERSGPGEATGYSLRVLANIGLLQDDFDRAIRYANRAIELFSSMGNARGHGMALQSLAEAERRISNAITHFQQGRTAEFLEQSIGHAEEAKDIFKMQVSRPISLIDTLLEIGRAYRDWTRLRLQSPDMLSLKEKETGTIYSVEYLTKASEDALNEAVTLSEKEKHVYRQIDALMSLGWLRFDTGLQVGATNFEQFQTELETEILDKIEQLIPSTYRITSLEETPRDSFLIRLGNLERLKGHVVFNHWLIKQQPDILHQAIEHYTLTLVYYNRYSSNIFREFRKTQDQIYERFTRLDVDILGTIYDVIFEVEKKYDLGRSPISEFLEDRFGMLDTFDSYF